MKFTPTHLWVKVTGNKARIGITTHAQKELGEIVFVDFPEKGKKFDREEEFAVVESTKAAVDLYCPITGTILEENQDLREDISLINSSPEENGWICTLEIDDLDELEELLSEVDYLELIGEELS